MSIEHRLHVDLMLQAMILASIADGRRPREEDKVALQLYAAAAGVPFAPDAYEALCASVAADPEGSWQRIAADQADLSVDQREELVRAVVRIAMADAELQDEELGIFRRVAQVLHLHARDVRRLMNEVWREERATAPPTDRRS